MLRVCETIASWLHHAEGSTVEFVGVRINEVLRALLRDLFCCVVWIRVGIVTAGYEPLGRWVLSNSPLDHVIDSVGIPWISSKTISHIAALLCQRRRNWPRFRKLRPVAKQRYLVAALSPLRKALLCFFGRSC